MNGWMEVLGAAVRNHPIMSAVRLEAYYQHYARHVFMDGGEVMTREVWWKYTVKEDPGFAAGVLSEFSVVLPDAEGAQL